MAVPGRAVFVLLVSFIASFSASDTTTAQSGRRAQSTPNVFKLEELTYPDVTALDRQKTMFLLPVGSVHEHGPHLPLGADTFGLMHEANGAAARVGRTLPDWNVVLMPSLNYGNSGANHIGRMFVHPGTYEIRRSTLRSLIADIGGQAAQNGFKWIFVLNGHSGPGHNISINDACDFVSETFGVTMLHVTALFRADPALQARGQKIAAQHFSAAELSSFGIDAHAGVGETSGMLAVTGPVRRRPKPPRHTVRPWKASGSMVSRTLSSGPCAVNHISPPRFPLSFHQPSREPRPGRVRSDASASAFHRLPHAPPAGWQKTHRAFLSEVGQSATRVPSFVPEAAPVCSRPSPGVLLSIQGFGRASIITPVDPSRMSCGTSLPACLARTVP